MPRGFAASLEKVACGAFSDVGFVSGLAGARKRRGFCGLPIRVATPERAFSDIGFVSSRQARDFAGLRRCGVKVNRPWAFGLKAPGWGLSRSRVKPYPVTVVCRCGSP
jgi:hypothetical protein